jgi:UMF1 family MFS transporter
MGSKENFFYANFNYIGFLVWFILLRFKYWSRVNLLLFFGLMVLEFGFIISYLPDAFPEQQDKISAKGFSLGYIGSVLLF